MTAPEERQNDVRQLIDSRPIFSSSQGESSSTSRRHSLGIIPNAFASSSKSKIVETMTRRDLGVSLKSKEDNASNSITPSTSAGATSKTLFSLCDYTSSSEDSH